MINALKYYFNRVGGTRCDPSTWNLVAAGLWAFEVAHSVFQFRD